MGDEGRTKPKHKSIKAMIVHREFAQGTQDWIEAHCGIPSASEFKNLVTDGMAIRKWSTEMPNSYLARKLAEAWGGPLPGFSAFATEQGKFLEDVAVPWYEFEHDIKVDRVGFCTTDDGRIGCSPDGLIGEDGGIEVKCLEFPNHIKLLLKGELPDEYAAQVHGSMLVTGRPWWRFLAYRRNFPPLLLQINRDNEIQETLSDALHEFLERFDIAWSRLLEMNGGPPPKREKMVFVEDIIAGREEDPDLTP